jgi:phage-related protein
MSDGKIIYDVEVNDEGAESKVKQTNEKLNSAANQGSGAFSEVWTGALRAIGGKLVELGQQAVSAAIDVGKEALAQTASFEQLEGGVKKLFDTSAGEVIENAKKAFSTAGMSANEYMENVTGFSASLISSLGGDTAEAAKLADVAIRDMSDNANTFGTDMQSITNTYQGLAKGNYSMLDNLKLGFAGTKQGMTDLIAEAAKYANEHKELGYTIEEGNLDFANCVKAINAMQEKMKIAGTTSAEAAGTIEGSVNSMKAAWTNFLTGTMSGEEFAQTAVQAADNVVNALMEIIPRLIEGFVSMAPTLIGKAVEIILNISSSIREKMPEFVAQGTEMIRNLGEGLATAIPEFLADALPRVLTFAENLRENAGKFIDAGIDMILNIVQGIADSLPTLIEYVPQIITNLANIINDNMPKILAAGVKIIVTLVKGIIQAIPTLIANIPHIIEAIFSVIQAVNWLNLGKFIIDGIKSGIVALSNALPNIMKSIGETAKNIVKNIDWRHLGSSIINLLVNGIQALVTLVPNMLRSIASTAFNAFRNIDWFNLGANVIRGILTGLASNASAVIDAARQVAQNALNAAKSFLGISSPSKAFAEVGQFSDEGQAEGMIENADLVENASREVAERALDAQMNVDYKLPSLDDASKEMSASLSSSISSTVQRIIEVPLNIDAREIARATAWDMGEQLAWEMR